MFNNNNNNNKKNYYNNNNNNNTNNYNMFVLKEHFSKQQYSIYIYIKPDLNRYSLI